MLCTSGLLGRTRQQRFLLSPRPVSHDFFRRADIQQLESHLKSKKQRELEARDPLIGQLQQMVDALQSSTDQLAATVTASVRSEVQHQLHVTVGR